MMNIKKLSLILFILFLFIFIFYQRKGNFINNEIDHHAECINGMITLYKGANGLNHFKQEIISRKIDMPENTLKEIDSLFTNGYIKESFNKISQSTNGQINPLDVWISALEKSYDLIVKMNDPTRIREFKSQGIDIHLYSLTGNTSLAKKHYMPLPKCLKDYN